MSTSPEVRTPGTDVPPRCTTSASGSSTPIRPACSTYAAPASCANFSEGGKRCRSTPAHSRSLLPNESPLRNRTRLSGESAQRLGERLDRACARLERARLEPGHDLADERSCLGVLTGIEHGVQRGDHLAVDAELERDGVELALRDVGIVGDADPDHGGAPV